MKSFLKFIVSIIVICIIGYTIYFLLSNSSKYDSTAESGEVSNSEFENNNQNKEYNQETESENIKDSGNSMSIDDINNSEEILSSGEKINKIVANTNTIRVQNNSASVRNTLDDNVGIDIIGTKYQEFFSIYNMTEAFVTVQVAGSMAYVIPASDFFDIAQYHYDENGNLLLYVDELIGVGGEVRYYFYDNDLLITQCQVEEDIVINYEDTQEILQRAKLIYDKYMK